MPAKSPLIPAVALMFGVSACSSAPVPASTAPVPASTAVEMSAATLSPPKVMNVSEAPAPGAGALAMAALHESPNLVSRLMRLAPGAVIAEHHHPSHDETAIIHSGTLRASVGGRDHTLRSGDVVHIPAGTVIVGRNDGATETVMVVVFASTGRPGPLTVPGQPGH